MKVGLNILLILLLSFSCKTSQNSEEPVGVRTLGASTVSPGTTIEIGFYNVENLFDTQDEPNKIDEDFLPAGRYNWTQEKYNQKLNQLALAISGIGKGGPEVLGLAEVENRKVVEDLTRTERLASRGYQVVHEESPDARGIDLALIYDPTYYTYQRHKAIRIRFPSDPDYTTRDILLVEGTINGKALYILVNHWPSRREGQQESEYRRVGVAQQLRAQIDSLNEVDPGANVIVMGDFNDDPFNKSIDEVLRGEAEPDQTDANELYNPMYNLLNPEDQGTLTYRGKWNLFDQILLSDDLLDKANPLVYINKSAKIYDKGLNVGFGRGSENPRRAIFRGNFDPEGFSDHYPVYIRLKVN